LTGWSENKVEVEVEVEVKVKVKVKVKEEFLNLNLNKNGVFMHWKRLVGQERIKDALSSAFVNNTLGHAYLFCGDAGVGKFAAAFELGMTLLCKSEGDRPCGTCSSCVKMLKYGHPDFHLVMPVALETEHRKDSKLTDEGWKYVSECAVDRISNPYRIRSFSSIPQVPLDWVKEVNQSILRGALEGERNVAIIDGIDMLSAESANAMLKTLEEPPKGTVMLLLTERIHSVLPTIISRCQIMRFSWLAPQVIADELSKIYSVLPQDKKIQDVAYCGSLGKARMLYEIPGVEVTSDAEAFWRLCAVQNWLELFTLIDKLNALDDYGAYEKFFTEMTQLIRNAFFNKLEGTENYIRDHGAPTIALGTGVTPEKIENLMEICGNAIRQIGCRANISLVFVNFTISLMEILNVEKQQAG